MEKIIETIKIFFITLFTAITSYMGILAIPVYILIGLEIFDYITGLTAAKYRNQKVNSYIGIKGIFKKVGMLSLVGMGAVIDWLLKYAGERVDINITAQFIIASLIAVWLICNELISILENLKDIGVPFPQFMLKIIENIKSKTEAKGDSDKE